jgi:hypothetical protein
MAANPETPISSLLLADSEHPHPDDDKEVTAAFVSYGATFQKVKKFAHNRLNLLAGLMWVHAHQDDLHVVWPAASVAQHRILAPTKDVEHNFKISYAKSLWKNNFPRKISGVHHLPSEMKF